VLNEISKLITRSFLSGLISFIITAFLVAGFVNLITPNVINEVSKAILVESNKNLVLLKTVKKDESLLEDLFINNPSTRNEIINNIKILEKSNSLYNSKDSIMLSVYNSIYSIIYDAEKKYPNEMINYPYKLDFIVSIRESYNIFASNTYTKLNALIKYYNALLTDKKDKEILWNNVVQADSDLNVSQAKFLSLSNKFKEIQETNTDK
jgi:hypothetical protein